MRKYIRPSESLGIKVPLRAIRATYVRVRHLNARRNLRLAIIGFPKCGTTALHAALLPNSELRGVNHESRSNVIICSTQGTSGINFIKNPNLVYEPWWLSTIDSVVGPTRYIICLRDPAAALHSFYWYRRNELSQSNSWIPKRNKPEIIPTEHEVMTGRADLLGASRSRMDYPKWINWVLQFIPKDRLMCIWLEDLTSNPRAAEERIDKFLGFESGMAAHYTVRNRNESKPKRRESSNIEKYNDDGFFSKVTLDTQKLVSEIWR